MRTEERVPIGMRTIVFATAALLAGTSGCGTDEFPVEPPEGYAYAVAQRDCAPADGPALSLYLTPTLVDAPHPAPPFVRVSVYESPGDVVGRTWSFDATTTVASAIRCTTTANCVNATSGVFKVGRFASDSSLDASVDLLFPDGLRVRGSVRGIWKSHTFFCG